MTQRMPTPAPIEWGAGYQRVTKTGLPVHMFGGTFYLQEGEDVYSAVSRFFNPDRTRVVRRKEVPVWDAMHRRIFESGEVYVYSRFPRAA